MKKLAFAILTAVAVSASPSAFAQVYVGLGIGPTNIDLSCTGTTSCDKTSNGGKLFGGYKFLPNLSAEVVYFDFGKAETTGPGAAAGVLKANGLGAGVAYMSAFSPPWMGVARAGLAVTRSKISGTLGTFTSADNKTSANPYVGIGLSYMVSNNMTVDLGVDYSRVKYDGQTDNVRLVSVGMTVGF